MDVAIEYDRQQNRGILRWQPNRLGRQPVAYRIYGSDEKGFSTSDEAFEVAAGVYDFRKKEASKPPTRFAANFLTETSAEALAVIGADVQLPANKAYYRVVAVDEKGNRSGPSDYAAAPRPAIFTTPLAQARAGTEYRHQVRAIRSLGDVRTRVVDGREVMNYWDVEQLRFHIEKGPGWLTIDEATGVLSGRPTREGRDEVVVAVTLEHEHRPLDPAQLQWGIEKTTDSRVRSLGIAKQSFIIEITP
jgi:hypothetical protein